MSLPDLSFGIEAQDRFSAAFDDLERQTQRADQQFDRLIDVLDRLEAAVTRATSGAGNLRAFGDASGAAVSGVRKLEQELTRLSDVRLDLGVDELRQQMDALGNDARQLENELLNMQFTGGSGGNARYRAQVEQYYNELARTQGDDAARLARGRGVVGNIGQIYAQHPDDVRPADEFSQRAYAEVKEKRRLSQEEQRRMLELEAQIYAARLAEAQTERAILERQAAEAESLTRGLEFNEENIQLFDQAEQAYKRLQDEGARLAQAETEAADSLADAKRRLRIDAARQASISDPDAPGGAVSTRTVISVSGKSADEAERLARALDQVAQAQERVAAITRGGGDALKNEIEAEREKGRIRAESARISESLVQLEKTSGEQARRAAQQAVEAERGNVQQKRQEVILAQQGLEAEKGNTQQKRVQVALAQAVNTAARQSVEAERGNTQEKRQAVLLAQQELELLRQQTIQIRQQTREQERQAAEAYRAQAISRQRTTSGGVDEAAFAGSFFGVSLGSFIENLPFAVANVARLSIEQGKLGAVNERLERSYYRLAEGAGIAGDALLNDLRAATRNTVSEQTLMEKSNLLLAASQEGQINVTREQIATLARFAQLRSTQLPNLTADDAFGRIISGTVKRETELLDELALSPKIIAEQLGIPVEQVNSSVQGLLNGIIAVSEIEIARFGEPVLDDAAKIEQAEARITDALDRLRAEAASPIAFVVSLQANVVEAAVDESINSIETAQDIIATATGKSTADRLIDALAPLDEFSTQLIARFQRSAAKGIDDLAAGQQVGRLDNARQVLGVAAVQAQLRIEQNTQSAEEQKPQLDALVGAVDSLAQSYLKLNALDNAGLLDAATAAAARAEWERIVSQIDTGKISTDQAAIAAARLEASLQGTGSALGFAIPQASDFANEMERAANAAQRVFIPGGEQRLGLSAFQLDYRTREDPLTKFQSDSQKKRADDLERLQAEQERSALAVSDAQFRLSLSTTDTAGQLALYEGKLATLEAGTVDYINTQVQIAGLQGRLASETEKAGGKFITSLNQMESAFNSALSAIGGIPGFSGRTQVTDTDLRLSKAGLYRDKPDEFLRRAEDLLINRNQRDDVSRKFIEEAVAASTGFDVGKLAGLQGDLLFKLLEEEFTSARLFGTDFGQANFGNLINQQGIAFGLQQQGQATLGKQFLENQFQSGGLPAIFANAGGFAGQLEEQLNNSGFSSQVGSIFNGQLTNDKVLTQIDNAAPAIYSRLESAILGNADGANTGMRLVLLWLAQMQQAESEVSQ